jgi:hypothetical protein
VGTKNSSPKPMITEVRSITTVIPSQPDDVLIVAASWEQRCLGLLTRITSYTAKNIIFIAYDSDNPKREENVRKMTPSLSAIGLVKFLRASHDNPLPNVRDVVRLIKQWCPTNPPRISWDTTSFTKKHLLQMLNAFDIEGFSHNINLYHTEPTDFSTHDNQPISHGISSVRAIETFNGMHLPSRDDVLIVFLGFEGARALALWQHLEPNVTYAVVPDPPYQDSWRGRTEKQNQYLLSSLPDSHVYYSHSLDPESTQKLLHGLIVNSTINIQKYNFLIAPLGTKAQTIGLFRFWRENRGIATLMYASPAGYNHSQPSFPAGRMWLVDKSEQWSN